MKSYTPESVTDAVLRQMDGTADERLKTIVGSAIRHLHAFAREVNLTPAEWLKAIEFFTRVGKTCTPTRQEFILLSDVIGLSTLVNTLHDATALEKATSPACWGRSFGRMRRRCRSAARFRMPINPRKSWCGAQCAPPRDRPWPMPS